MSTTPTGHDRPPVLLVMSREIRQRLRSKAFILSTVALVAGVLAIGILLRAQSDEPTTYDVAVAGRSPDGFAEATEAAASLLDVELRVTDGDHLSDEGRIEAALREGDVDAVVDADRGELVTVDGADDDLATALDLRGRRRRHRR